MNEFVIDKKMMRRSFSRAAAGYDATAVLQREVCTRMLERLDYIKMKPARLLDAGSGTGWGGRQLAAKYPDAQIIALDIAIGMLQTALEPFGLVEKTVWGRTADGGVWRCGGFDLWRRTASRWYGRTWPCSGAMICRRPSSSCTAY